MLSIGHILASHLVVTGLFMHLLSSMILLYLAIPISTKPRSLFVINSFTHVTMFALFLLCCTEAIQCTTMGDYKTQRTE